MATKKPTTPTTTAKQDAPKTLTINGMDGNDFVSMVDRQVKESEDYWNKTFKLDTHTKENVQIYLGQQISDDDDGNDPDLTLDNRIFSSVRTVVPYVTTRVTEPEVYPSSNSVASKKFAEDFEKSLHIKANMENVKTKVKFGLEDAIVQRRGYLAPRYDALTQNFCAIEYVPCESIIIDHKAKPFEEPRYYRRLLDKSVEDLIAMFPDMEVVIYATFKLTKDSPKADLQMSRTVNEDWKFVVDANSELDLICAWSYNKVAFGYIQDPNWRYGKANFLDHHMAPLVFINVLSDGRTMIDKTSYVEQSKYLQRTIDRRGKQIGENAGLGNIGMPVVDSAALADDQAQYVTFEPNTVLELDVNNAGKASIGDVFTTWKAGTLSPDVYNDKTDAIAGVQNAFGASAVNQGNQTDSNTLGQDEMLRDQSMGRQAEIVDAIDTAMQRLYLLMAQFMLVYGKEDELFKFVGENSEFDYIILDSSELDTNAEIRIKSGTSMPIDNPQRRATVNAAATAGFADPLTYWEIMDEPNAQKYAKRVADWIASQQGNGPGYMQDISDEIFDRNAYSDIQLLKGGKQPPYRDDLDKVYFDYLNQYVVSGDLENPKIPLETRQVISQFIDIQLQRGQKMLGMAETQLPTTQDVNQYNQQTDEANAANNAAMKGMPPAAPSAPQPGQAPGTAPQPQQPPAGAPPAQPQPVQ